MNFRPLQDFVLVSKKASPEKSAGGILLVNLGGVRHQEAIEAVVFAVGPGKPDHPPPSVAVGNVVLIQSTGGTDIEIHGEKFVIVRDTDILGVVE